MTKNELGIEMGVWFFTFKEEDKDRCGRSLKGKYVKVIADTKEEAREKMVEARGLSWDKQYYVTEFFPTYPGMGWDLEKTELEKVWLVWKVREL